MKATFKRMANNNYELIIEAQNDEEDSIIEEIYVGGSILALGQAQNERRQLILSTGIEPR